MLQARRVEGRASVGLEPVRIWNWGPPGCPFHPPVLIGLFGEAQGACTGLSFYHGLNPPTPAGSLYM